MTCGSTTGRELVSVPANQFIASAGVNCAQRASVSTHFAFMVHHVACQRVGVCFEVKSEVFEQLLFAQEIEIGCRVIHRIDVWWVPSVSVRCRRAS
jgi:hypothetical protein